MIPPVAKQTIDDYVNLGLQPGDFIRAVLTNNLKEAFGRADSENREAMFDIVSYCYNHIPASCWGSPEAVEAWLSFKHQQRRMMEQANKPCSAHNHE